MGRSERRHWAQVYVQGLLLDGERKSIEPMAARIPGADVEALRQFVGQSPWAVEEVQRRLAGKMVDLLSDAQVWTITRGASGWDGIITCAWSRWPTPSCVLSGRGLKRTSGATWTLPQARRTLLAQLLRIIGRCPWCMTEFNDTS